MISEWLIRPLYKWLQNLLLFHLLLRVCHEHVNDTMLDEMMTWYLLLKMYENVYYNSNVWCRRYHELSTSKDKWSCLHSKIFEIWLCLPFQGLWSLITFTKCFFFLTTFHLKNFEVLSPLLSVFFLTLLGGNLNKDPQITSPLAWEGLF